MKLNRTAVEQAFAQYSGETADGEGTPRQVLCAALCAQCAQQVEALVRPELTQEEEAPWQGALEALAGAEAFYQLLLTEEASAPQSLSVGEGAVSRGAGSERAAALAAEKRRAASPALREEHFFFGAVGEG